MQEPEQLPGRGDPSEELPMSRARNDSDAAVTTDHQLSSDVPIQVTHAPARDSTPTLLVVTLNELADSPR